MVGLLTGTRAGFLAAGAIGLGAIALANCNSTSQPPMAAARVSPSPTPRTEPGTPEEYLTMATILVDAGDFSAAESLLQEGHRKFPSSAGFHLVQARIYLGLKHDFDAFMELQWEAQTVGVERELGKAAQRGIEEIVTGSGPEIAEVRRVNTALKEKQAGKSLAALKAIDEARPGRFMLRMFLAEAYVRHKQEKEAEPIFRDLLARDPMFVPAYVALADLMAKKGTAAGKTEASELREKARKVDPQHWALKK